MQKGIKDWVQLYDPRRLARPLISKNSEPIALREQRQARHVEHSGDIVGGAKTKSVAGQKYSTRLRSVVHMLLRGYLFDAMFNTQKLC
jgi:hypothetical protein